MTDIELVMGQMDRVIDGVENGALSADQGDAMAKAGYVKVKAMEIDLKRRWSDQSVEEPRPAMVRHGGIA